MKCYNLIIVSWRQRKGVCIAPVPLETICVFARVNTASSPIVFTAEQPRWSKTATEVKTKAAVN